MTCDVSPVEVGESLGSLEDGGQYQLQSATRQGGHQLTLTPDIEVNVLVRLMMSQSFNLLLSPSFEWTLMLTRSA